MRLRAISTMAAVVTLTACAGDAPSLAPSPVDETPSLSQQSGAGEWMVVLRDDVSDVGGAARQLAAAYGTAPTRVYQHALKGFALPISAQGAAALAAHPFVRYVEPDIEMTTLATQTGATWGLDRIDQRALPLSGTYTYTPDGSGVTAYIIDTGLRYDHSEFYHSATNTQSRATFGYDALGGNGADCHGHGTHVGGTVGGRTYGVAKQVSLVSVRVLNCSGTGSTLGIVAALDWMVQTHATNAPAVGNMSLGGGASQALDDAVQGAISDGITMVVAAGNSNANACNYSPARAPNAITLGASTSADARASFSNYGSCVDFFAPGVSITSAWYTGVSATNTISGTSMASPHAAGAAALYLAVNPTASPNAVRDGLYTLTTKGIITSSNSANNHLLYTLEIGGGSPPPPPPPGDLVLTSTVKTKGTFKVFLAWTGSAAASIDVYRNGTRVATVANTGAYTDNLGRTKGAYTHHVCEAGTSTCSNSVTNTF
jgi:serine protease